jgi:hypothetical protein
MSTVPQSINVPELRLSFGFHREEKLWVRYASKEFIKGSLEGHEAFHEQHTLPNILFTGSDTSVRTFAEDCVSTSR